MNSEYYPCDPNSPNEYIVNLIGRFRDFENNNSVTNEEQNEEKKEQDGEKREENQEQYQFFKTLGDIEMLESMCNEREIQFNYTRHIHWCSRVAFSNNYKYSCDYTCESPNGYVYEWYLPQIVINIHVDTSL